MLGLSLWRQGAAGGPAALERALAHAEAAHDPAVYRVVATTYGGMVCEGPMPVAEGLALFGELLGANEHDRVVQGVITRFRSLLLAMAGRFDEANDGLLRSSAFLDELNLLTPSWVYRRVAGAAKELMGDLAGAEDDLIARLESFRDLRDGGPDGRAIEAVAWLAHLYCDQGRWQAADDLLGYSRQVPPLAFFRAEAVLCSAAEARLAAHNGNGAKAVERAQRAVDVVAPTDLKHMHARLWLALAEVQRHAGNTKGADQAVLRALELYEAKGNVAAATLLRGKRGVALPDAAR
jgi:tetratricopeptide (TPR) repeat protein